jgi:hypothetical protein
MSYATYDFTESISRVGLDRAAIERVVAAWGSGDGQGEDAGHCRWAEDGVTDWSGGFLMRLRDGRYAYLTGWCDYTGWGCQDGARVEYFDAEPASLSTLTRFYDPEVGHAGASTAC